MDLAFSGWSLGLEASSVIAMRLTRLAAFDAAAFVEARLMVVEKIEAAAQLQGKALTGGLGVTPVSVAHGSLAHYRAGVAKNRRRLKRAKR
ncbi:hypothetical protein [Sphingomonas montanisoli]|nr:hypothetical protein [Sphingomonas montanisoli]